MKLSYRVNAALSLDQFIQVYRSSTLSQRRPVDNLPVMQSMMQNASLTLSAWRGDQLVGLSRTLTDYGYVAYLADLAVDLACQGQGIGRELIKRTRAELGPDCMLVLLAAPAANEFYPRVGFTNNPRAWVLPADDPLI